MRGFVVLDGEMYKILELEESDSFDYGTRFVSLTLVELREVTKEDEDAQG